MERSLKEQYRRIWNNGHDLIRRNHGSTIKITCIFIPEVPPQFEITYIFLDTCKKSLRLDIDPSLDLMGSFLWDILVGSCYQQLDMMQTIRFL